MYGQTRINEKIPCFKRKNKINFTDKQIQKCEKKSKDLSKKRKMAKRLTTLDIILHRKNQPRSVYYFTHGRKINHKIFWNLENVKESPFYIPRDIQDFSFRTKYREDRKDLREKAKTYTYSNRPNHNTGLSEDKLERLLVPDSSIILPGKSIVDQIHPDYYKVIGGRPIRDRVNINDYILHLKELFLTRLQIGYRQDEAYLIEEQYLKEKKKLSEVQKNFQFYSDCYDKFLSEDHASSIVLLREAEIEMKKSKSKKEKIRHYVRICGWYRSKILALDDQWRRGKILQKFLYQISPLWWRNKYDFIHKVDDTGEIDFNDTNIFDPQRSNSLNTVHSVVSIIEEFLDCLSNYQMPQLYFENPLELLHIFYEMERSNLLALLQCEQLTPPAQQMVLGLEKARAHFVTEVKILREYMKALEDEVIFEENRSKECEQRAKAISFGFFRDLIVDKYTLNLYVNVEDCYEVCVAPNDGNLSLLMMMKAIEHKQESTMAALDKLPNDITLQTLANCYREDKKIFREAQEATKMIVQIENLMKTLRKSLEPKREGKPGRKLLWRSDPPKEKMDIVIPPQPLTKEQLEYLYFFTDFCPAKDDQEFGKELYANRLVNLTKKD